MCELSDTITTQIKSFRAKEECRSKGVVKAHARAKAAHKAFGDKNGIDLPAMKMKDDGGEPTNVFVAVAKALRVADDAAERAMRFICTSAHAILLLSNINFLREEALRIRPDRKHFREEQLKVTLTYQSFFDALA